MEAGIGALFVGFADWVEGGVEVVGAGTSREADALRKNFGGHVERL
jgi:hypothetical protein